MPRVDDEEGLLEDFTAETAQDAMLPPRFIFGEKVVVSEDQKEELATEAVPVKVRACAAARLHSHCDIFSCIFVPFYSFGHLIIIYALI